MSTPFHHGAHTKPARQYFGMYLGTVANTRSDDLWVRLRIPQVIGEEISGWARPIGFNSVGATKAPVADTNNDGRGTDEHTSPLAWGGFVPTPTPAQSGRPIGVSPVEQGPGPAVGSLVLVWFVAGDINRPAYALTSQKVM